MLAVAPDQPGSADRVGRGAGEREPLGQRAGCSRRGKAPGPASRRLGRGGGPATGWSAGRAALIYLLEPVFAAAYSIAWGLDVLTLRLVTGGVLILGGNLLVELPLWLRDVRKR